jgi:hypothetical protein
MFAADCLAKRCKNGLSFALSLQGWVLYMHLFNTVKHPLNGNRRMDWENRCLPLWIQIMFGLEYS